MTDIIKVVVDETPIKIYPTDALAVANEGRITDLETAVDGLTIGEEVLAYDAGVQQFAGVTFAANKSVYWSADNVAVAYDLTAYGRTVAGLANAAALKSNLSISNISDTTITTTGNITTALDMSARDIAASRFITAGSDITATGDLYALGNDVHIGTTVQLQATGLGGINIKWKIASVAKTTGLSGDSSGNVIALGFLYEGGTSTATGKRLHSDSNPPKFIATVPYDTAVWAGDFWQQTAERPADTSPTILTAAKTYWLSAGDLGRNVASTATGATIQCQEWLDGQSIRIANISAGNITLRAGSRTWFGQGANKEMTVPTGGVVVVTRYGATLAYVTTAGVTFGAAAAAACTYTIVTAGQSNSTKPIQEGGFPFGLWHRWNNSTTDAEIPGYNYGEDFYFVVGGLGASALLKDNSASNYWWDKALAVPGPRLDALIAAIEAIPAAQPKPDVILWDQGEADRTGLANAVVTAAEYQAALVSVFNYIRTYSYTRAATVLTSVPICIIPLGADDTASVTQGAYVAVREAQFNVAVADANTYLGPEKYDMPRKYTDVHLTFKGYTEVGKRFGDWFANLVKAASNDIGPTITAASVSFGTNTMVVPMTSVQGLFRPQSGSDPGAPLIGLTARTTGDPVAATYLTPLSFAWSGSSTAATLTVTFAETVSSGYQLAYPVGSMAEIRKLRHIRQRGVGGLPLRTYAP